MPSLICWLMPVVQDVDIMMNEEYLIYNKIGGDTERNTDRANMIDVKERLWITSFFT